MEIHQLRYFVAVAELLSFTKAATRCHVSQPSLSQQIQKLEQDLGVQLLDRLGRRVKLTDAGDAFYERAAAALDAIDDAKSCVQSSLDWQKGAITVGAIHTIAPYLLPEVVRRLIQRFPEAQITVEEQLTEELIANCLAGELDVGIVALPIAEQRVRAEPLFTEQLVAAVPVDNPLAKKKRVTLNDVISQPFVLLDDMHCLGRQTLQFCAGSRGWRGSAAGRPTASTELGAGGSRSGGRPGGRRSGPCSAHPGSRIPDARHGPPAGPPRGAR
jgi:LysR family hydrogen peroxide-inducible transcriptional activator